MDAGRLSSFGALLRHHRVAAGLTQEELAERARLSARSVGDIERGVSRAPHRETVALLADALALAAESRAAFEAAARRRLDASTAALPASLLPAETAAPPLVGRERELALLERHLAGAGGPPVLMLAGEPGIGKSRLLAAAGLLAAGAGWHVVAGGCQRRSGEEPYAPLPGALKACLRARPPARLRAELDGCAWLVRLLPELAEGPIAPLPPWAPGPDQERRLVAEATARFCANTAGPAGTLLVLDDLQWAGPDVFDLLGVVLRLAAGSLRIVGAYRDTEVRPDSPLSVALADLAHAGLALHRTLAPLGEEAGRALFERLLGQDAPAGSPRETAAGEEARVLERAGGVPFVIVSFAQALLLGEGAEAAGPPATGAVPWNVSQSVRHRVGALPETVQAVLREAAVAGRTPSPALLASAGGGTEEEVLSALAVARRAGLLSDGPDGYRFAHDIIREVIEGDLGMPSRRATHRRMAAAIEALQADRLSEHYESLADHYEQGEVWDRAIDYLVKSADKARAGGAMGAALALYGRTLALCERLGPPARATVVAITERRGSLRTGLGDFAGAAADYLVMHEAAAAMGDRRQAARALAARGVPLLYNHDFAAAEETLRAALEQARDFDDVLFLTNVLLAEVLIIVNRHAEAAVPLAAAEKLSGVTGDAMSQAWWLDLQGMVLQWQGQFERALASLSRWRQLDATQELSMLLFVSWEETLAHGGRGDYARALVLLDELIAQCERLGETFVRARALNTAGWIYGELHDHQRALELNAQSLEAARAIETANPEIQNNAHLNLGDTLVALGRLDEAREHYEAVEQVVRHPRPRDHFMLWRYTQHFLHSYGAWLLARGEVATARAYADECLRAAEASGSAKNIVKARRLRAQTLLAQGQHEEAGGELTAALETARQVGNPPQLWKTLAAQADLWAAQGRHEEARRARREAARVIQSVAAGLGDETLRATFLAAAPVQAITRRA